MKRSLVSKVLFLFLLTLTGLYATNSVSEDKTILNNDKWIVRGHGFGKFTGKNPNLSQLLKAYSATKITTGITPNPLIWRSSSQLPLEYMGEVGGYLSFSEHGEELFRISCNSIPTCNVNEKNSVIFNLTATFSAIKKHSYLQEDESYPTFVSKKFKTETGLKVGSRLKDIVLTYPHIKNSLYIYQFYTVDGIEFDEVVCFKPNDNQKREDVHFLSFVLKSSKKGKLIGVYAKSKWISKTMVDLNARIIAIENNTECDPDEATHVG